jgi:hypothetical protein
MSRANPRFRRNNPALPVGVPNWWQVNVQGVIEGQATLTSFFYSDNNAALIAASESNLAAAWIANCLTAYKGALSADWAGLQMIVKSLSSPTRNTFITTTGIAGVAGTGPAGHEPTIVCVTIDRYTPFRGQCGRGRIGVPAVPTGWVTASQLTNLTAHTALATNMLAVFVGAGVTYTPGLFSRGSRTTHTQGFATLVQAQLRVVLGTIRRRKLARGI